MYMYCIYMIKHITDGHSGQTLRSDKLYITINFGRKNVRWTFGHSCLVSDNFTNGSDNFTNGLDNVQPIFQGLSHEVR